MTATRGSVRDWLVMSGMFAVLVALVAVWLVLDRRPPEWDHANHLERAVLCARDLGTGDVDAILERSSFYPPVVLCAAAAVYRLWPTDVASAQSVILAFLALGMVATYLLGRRMADRGTGLAAALLFATAPFVVYSMLRFQLDLPLAAAVATALWALAATERFTRPGWALLAGLVLGLGTLTKPTFPVYVLPPMVLMLPRARARAPWLNVAVTSLVALAVSLPWYGLRLTGMLSQIGARSFKQAAESGHPDPLSWAGVTYYPRLLVTQFGVIAVLALAAGLVVAIRRRQGMILTALLVPFLLFTLLQNKNLRYTLPLLPAAAIVAGMALSALGRRVKPVAVGVAVLAGITQVSATMFSVPALPDLPWLGESWVLASEPVRDDWKQREILALIARHAGATTPATVSVVPNVNFFSVSNFRYYALRDGLRLAFVRAWDDAPIGIEYMVVKSGHQGPSWTADKSRRVNDRLTADEALARVFPVIGEFDLPDGSRAAVRARHVPAVAAAPGAVARAIDGAIRQALPMVARDVDGFDVALDWDDRVLRGHVRRIVISARAAAVGELTRRHAAVLRVRDMRLTVEDALVNPWSAVEKTRVDWLDAGRIRLDRATIEAEDLRAFLGGVRRGRGVSVALEDGRVHFTLGGRGPRLSAHVEIVSVDDRPFALSVDRVAYAGIPVPSFLVNWVVRNYDPTPRIAARLPVPVRIGEVAVDSGAIRIGARPEGVSGR
jgi:4-amino-4-deoxy-L-arabinose transferase-like glycosyltransferase